MIDFLSTRPGVRPEDAACIRLFAAVIARAVTDATCTPSRAERSGRGSRKTMDKHALNALDFLFGQPSVLGHYADMVGLDALAMRRALIAGDFGRVAHGPLNESHARILRMRLQWSGIDYQRWLS